MDDGNHLSIVFFFFNDTATTEIYTLSLHDALPICEVVQLVQPVDPHLGDGTQRPRGILRLVRGGPVLARAPEAGDRKSTRLNSSHANISYAVFCLKKKKSKISSQ